MYFSVLYNVNNNSQHIQELFRWEQFVNGEFQNFSKGIENILQFGFLFCAYGPFIKDVINQRGGVFSN